MIIDIIVLIVLLISAGIAFMRGFIREVLTIAGVIGGLAAAYFGAPLLQPHMQSWFGVEEGVVPESLFGAIPYDILADVLSYGLIFIIVVAILSFVSHSLAEGARKIGLGAVDRSLGFMFGLVRGVLLLGLLYLPLYLFVDKDAQKDWSKDSKTHFYLERVSAAMATYLPENAEDTVKKAADQGQKIMDTREKLQEVDLLKKDDVPVQQQTQELKSDTSTDGYNEEFRDKMDQLIDEKVRVDVNE